MIRYSLKTLLIRGHKIHSTFALNSPIVRSISSINAKVNLQNETIELHHASKNKESPSKSYEFPFVYLRDNCQCTACFHAASHSRIINWENFDVSIKPKNIQFDTDSQKLKVEWDDADNHESEYSYDWLKARNFTENDQPSYFKHNYRLPKNLWNKNEFSNAVNYFKFDEIVNSDFALYKWLECFITNGVAIISDVPHSEKEARVIAERVAFIRQTHYGKEFVVKAKSGTSNVAYLPANLQMHTDLPYYDYAPGVNLLHCLVQSKSAGAQNLLTDGFFVAKRMEREYSNEFKLLSTALVNWFDIGQEEDTKFHSMYRAPIFCHNFDGQLERVNHSIPQRDSILTIPLSDVKNWYSALSLFVKLIHEEAAEIKTAEGSILCFDNSRIIHGRKEYQDTDDNERYIIGSYLDWDEIYSKFRVLKNTFDK